MTLKHIVRRALISNIGIFVVLVVSVTLFYQGITKQVQALKEETDITELKNELQGVSNFLTTQIRLYALTGDQKYYDAYLEEVNELQSFYRV